ncbi:hypothetical protein [Algibacter sp. 2305UL17-15]|uniref:hypothetical protein n=1 Tax=Algibacter sp. 2305UL17-15 TaxID=3231268 RepID=UPI0034598F9A
MKKILLVLFSITLIYNCSSDSNSSDSSDETKQLTSKLGIWEGTGTQPGLTWTIKITLNSNEQLIEYPSLECGGYLTLISETSSQLLFRETITYNSICADQGFIELTVTSDSTMDYKYYFPNASNEKGTLGASGSISKT